MMQVIEHALHAHIHASQSMYLCQLVWVILYARGNTYINAPCIISSTIGTFESTGQ